MPVLETTQGLPGPFGKEPLGIYQDENRHAIRSNLAFLSQKATEASQRLPRMTRLGHVIEIEGLSTPLVLEKPRFSSATLHTYKDISPHTRGNIEQRIAIAADADKTSLLLGLMEEMQQAGIVWNNEDIVEAVQRRMQVQEGQLSRPVVVNGETKQYTILRDAQDKLHILALKVEPGITSADIQKISATPEFQEELARYNVGENSPQLTSIQLTRIIKNAATGMISIPMSTITFHWRDNEDEQEYLSYLGLEKSPEQQLAKTLLTAIRISVHRHEVPSDVSLQQAFMLPNGQNGKFDPEMVYELVPGIYIDGSQEQPQFVTSDGRILEPSIELAVALKEVRAPADVQLGLEALWAMQQYGYSIHKMTIKSLESYLEASLRDRMVFFKYYETINKYSGLLQCGIIRFLTNSPIPGDVDITLPDEILTDAFTSANGTIQISGY